MNPGTDVEWHALGAAEVLRRLDSDPHEGLSEAEASARLARHGPNRVRTTARTPAWRVLADQFTSVVVLLLAVAAGIALLIGDRMEAAAIGAVLVINTAIGFVVELRARRAMEALIQYEAGTARVVRDGVERNVPAPELVPGDVVILAPGDAVPADARVLEAADLRVVESALTGESLPVDKSAEAVADVDVAVADRTSMIHSGTSVAVGQARAVVVTTGSSTELGRIGELVAGIEEERTPLERRMDALGHRLVWLALGAAGVMAGVGVARGSDFALMLEAGIALAIAAVPEGLPAVATIALAAGLRRMARRNALVRRLSAVEGLGSTTVVCSDKTGTLTAGEMTAVAIETLDRSYHATGTGYGEGGAFTLDGAEVRPEDHAALREALEAGLLAARSEVDREATTATGDPTDAALVVAASKAGIERDALLAVHPPTGEIPFSSERRLSASFHRDGTEGYVAVKGALDAILDRCASAQTAEGTRTLGDEDRARLRERNRAMAEDGLRVIAVAGARTAEPVEDPRELPKGLEFLALFGLLDPPAEGVRETIQGLRRAGIRVVMITGDQAGTALAVARELAMVGEDGVAVEGRDLYRLDEAALRRTVREASVFSRVDPEQKLRLVEAFRAEGEIVAMLGDGVNDAAALKRADIGVAMGGRGTDVAKETASVVLQDDRFPTVAVAVEEGRVIYDNIRKFVFYLFSCNVAEVFVLVAGAASGLPLPLLPLQILWLNLVTDTFPALALAFEPAEPSIMERPPRPPEASILSRRFVGSISFYGALIAASTLCAFAWGLLTGPVERAVTLSFMTLALAQLFHLGNARSRQAVLRPSRMFANRWAVGAVPLVIGLQVLAVHWPPLAEVLGTVPLTPIEWAGVAGISVVPAVVGQVLELASARGGGTLAPIS